MNEILATIREVQEGGKGLANWYLSHGYILLDIQSSARAQHYPEGLTIKGDQYYIRRNPVFVLGRPDGVEPAPAPPQRTKPGEKAEDKVGATQENVV